MSFRLTEEHLKLLQGLNIGYLYSSADSYVIPRINNKKPFMSDNMEADVMKILGWDEKSREKIPELLAELPLALEVVLRNMSFKPGEYETDRYGVQWEFLRWRNRHRFRVEQLNKDIETLERELLEYKEEREKCIAAIEAERIREVQHGQP